MEKFSGLTNMVHNYHVLRYGLHTYKAQIKKKLLGKSESAYRREIALGNAIWGTKAVNALAEDLPFDLTTAHPAEMALHKEVPFIIVPNHTSMMDIYAVCRYMHEADHNNLRWIMAAHVRKFPFIGSGAAKQGSAFISRTGSPKDLKEIVRCAGVAREDRADVVIFPEGTRFSPERAKEAGGEYRNVLPPKVTGLKLLRENLPDHKLLSITTKLRTIKPLSDVLSPNDLIGCRITMVATIHDVQPAEIVDWLNAEWHRKDRLLDDDCPASDR